MKGLRNTKSSRILLIVVLVILVVCLLFYNDSNKLHGKPGKAKFQKSSERTELVQALRRTSMMDSTVIVTIVDEAESTPGSVLDLFLESFQIGEGTKTLSNHLLIVATDTKAFNYCKFAHPHCFQLEKQPTTSNHLTLIRKRNLLLLQVLQSGHHIVFTDVDVMWLRNPFPHFHSSYEISIPCDFPTDDNSQSQPQILDKGLFMLRSDAVTIEFLIYWNMETVLYPDSLNISLCEITFYHETFKRLGVRVKYVDTVYYSGFCQPNKDITQVCVIHADCCNKIESKVYDLRRVLDDWINFKARSSENDSSLQVPLTYPWRAPNKCGE